MFLTRSFDSSLTSNVVGQCRVPFLPLWFLLTPILVFESFNSFILPTPMNLRLILFIVDWLWSLSISIHSSILSNYQHYIFCPFSYNMSISIHVYFHFHIFCHFLCIPIHFVNSLQFVQIYGWLLFVCGPLYLSISIPLMYVCGLLCPKALFEDSWLHHQKCSTFVHFLYFTCLFHITKHSG